MTKVVAASAAPDKIILEFDDDSLWEYTRGEVSYTEWNSGTPQDWFIPNELDFLVKINNMLKEAVAQKKKRRT